MNVIPVINCPDAACAKEKLVKLAAFYPADGLVHLDVTDGDFSSHHAWFDPAAWQTLAPTFGLEVHLMVRHPEEFIGPWIAAGAKRLIVHVETLSRESAEAMADMAKQHGVELMLAENPETPMEALQSYFDLFRAFQILAVHPGPAGQELIPVVFEKISALRLQKQNATIEIDGGVNLQTAEKLKAAGADTVACGTYIFNSEDPKSAYEALSKI